MGCALASIRPRLVHRMRRIVRRYVRLTWRSTWSARAGHRVTRLWASALAGLADRSGVCALGHRSRKSQLELRRHHRQHRLRHASLRAFGVCLDATPLSGRHAASLWRWRFSTRTRLAERIHWSGVCVHRSSARRKRETGTPPLYVSIDLLSAINARPAPLPTRLSRCPLRKSGPAIAQR